VKGASAEGKRFETSEAPWGRMKGGVSPPTRRGVWAEDFAPPHNFLNFWFKMGNFLFKIFCIQAKGEGITQCPLNMPLNIQSNYTEK